MRGLEKGVNGGIGEQERAVALSGIKLSEWMAIEDGHVPQETDRLRSMAAVLEVGSEKMLNWVALCREAWEL
jgi:hypothetical protein